MLIRPATPQDVPAVLPMVIAQYHLHTQWDAARFAPSADFHLSYARWLIGLAEDDRAVFLVADVGTDDQPNVVGYIAATIDRNIPIYKVLEYGFIHDLWINESYRNEGTGKQLALQCLEVLSALGVKQIRLETAAQNDVSRSLFASLGFRPAVVQMTLDL